MRKYKDLLLRFLPILLVMLLTIGFSEMVYQNMVASATDRCWEDLNRAHDEAAGEIATQLNNNLKMLDLASEAIVLNADFENEATVLRYLFGVQDETIFDRIDVLYPDGTILVNNGDRIANYDQGDYWDLVEEGTHLSQREPDYYTGQEAIRAYSTVYTVEGEPIAILGASIYCKTLGEIFTSAHYGEDARMFLVDMRDGKLVLDKWHEVPGSIYDMRAYEGTAEAGKSDFIDEILAGGSGTLPYASQLYGKTSYTVYAPVENTNYNLVMVVQEDDIFSSLNELKDTLTKVGIVEVGLLLFFALWIYFILRKSMKSETRAQQAELALLQQKERVLENQYALAANRQEFLEVMALNLPGGYHRCTTDHDFRLTFASNSFCQITGYTMEQLQEELGGSYMGIVAPEDREFFLSLAPQLERDGFIQCAYRMRRRDGSLRWVQDSTQYINRDGESYYQCALADITEQIQEIERAKQIAEASSQAKSTFLFNISHDIRTPMNAIKGFSHIIQENAENPELVLDAVGKICQASDSLMLLMNDVLDISRIERGKEEVNPQPMDLYEHGKNLYEMFAADMKEAGITFTAGGDLINDYVYCDHLKLTRIMMNMLSNAKKFTPPGGSVTFGGTRLHREGKSCTYRFFVRDTGIGMSQEFQKRAFEQFERERTSTESGIAGSGLGLAIIKMMVELMGGTVEIQSALGKGTEISAILTLQMADRDQTVKSGQQVQKPLNIAGKRILLVEDNSFNREIARYILEGMELVVDEAEHGAACIDKLLAEEPGCYDMILMDIQMPVMDGYTATAEIRNLDNKRLASIPIVAMTANAFEEDRQKCLDMGMDGHIGKPIDMDALIQMLSKVF